MVVRCKKSIDMQIGFMSVLIGSMSLGGVIGLYILINLEIHAVFINSSKIYKFSNSLGLVFTNLEVFPRI